jgi:diketogulonate reductase-like aldo/keto reductase
VLVYLYNNAKVKPSIVQNRFYAQSGYDKEIRAFCEEKGIRYESFWSLTANPHILNSEILKELAMKYDREVTQIFYKYLNHLNIIPLNGTTSTKHMIDDLKIMEFELLDAEMKQITILIN